jgi:hypothetical protein
MNRQALTRIWVFCWAMPAVAGLLFSACEFGAGKEPADNTGNDLIIMADTGGNDLPESDLVSPDQSAPDVGAETCGNGVCDKNEDPCSCQEDCKSSDNCCQSQDCPQPKCGPCCQAVCVDFQCEDEWLSPCCWNGECEEGENWENCPEDCEPTATCGDGICQEGETPCDCPQDCLVEGGCCYDEDCPQPQCGPCCSAFCVDGLCQDEWATPCCWNGECEEGETWENCPEDCEQASGCGDGICQDDENPCTCPKDCTKEVECCEDLDCPQPKCGPCCHGVCTADLTCEEIWDSPCCWNGVCEEGETFDNCPQDCAEEANECQGDDGICVTWLPGDETNCPDGMEETGLKCDSKNEVCCQKDGPPPVCDFFACQVNSDCVKTNAGCCPCSSGGQSIALAADCADDWLKGLNCPPDLMCLTVYMCDDSVPVCLNNMCKLSM